MIAALSPSSMCYEDTHNTLKYANRAKCIKTKVIRNELKVNFHITRYTQIISELHAENLALKERLRDTEGVHLSSASFSLCLSVVRPHAIRTQSLLSSASVVSDACQIFFCSFLIHPVLLLLCFSPFFPPVQSERLRKMR
jgi:hypothetical protein